MKARSTINSLVIPSSIYSRVIHKRISVGWFGRGIHLTDDLLLEARHKLLTLVGGLITQANIIELTELIR